MLSTHERLYIEPRQFINEDTVSYIADIIPRPTEVDRHECIEASDPYRWLPKKDKQTIQVTIQLNK